MTITDHDAALSAAYMDLEDAIRELKLLSATVHDLIAAGDAATNPPQIEQAFLIAGIANDRAAALEAQWREGHRRAYRGQDAPTPADKPRGLYLVPITAGVGQ